MASAIVLTFSLLLLLEGVLSLKYPKSSLPSGLKKLCMVWRRFYLIAPSHIKTSR